MTAPFIPIDIAALDLASEAGQANALQETITILNSMIDVLNSAGTTVPLLGTGNTGGLLTASQKTTLTGHGNADSLHTHSGLTGTDGSTGNFTAGYLLVASDPGLANGRIVVGVAGQIITNDLGAGATFAIGLADSGAVAGSYPKVTVDSKGRVLSGGSLLAADLPAHTHVASDIISGTFAAARYGTGTVGLPKLDPAAAPDGYLLTVSAGTVIASPAPVGTGEVNTASNVNLTGFGFFRAKVGVNLEFLGLSVGAGLLLTDDAGNKVRNVAPDFGTGATQIAAGNHTHDARYYQKSEVDNLIRVLNTQNKTANYTLTTSDQMIRADSTGGAITLTLPLASSNLGKVVYIKRVNLFGNTVHIVPSGADKIDAIYTDWELWDRNEYVELVAATANWEVVSYSGSTALIDMGPIGAGIPLIVKPNKQNFKATATVNNGLLTLSGMVNGQAAHIQLMSGAGGFLTLFAGQGSLKAPNGVALPNTTVAAGKIDEIYATFNGTDTLITYRGQGF